MLGSKDLGHSQKDWIALPCPGEQLGFGLMNCVLGLWGLVGFGTLWRKRSANLLEHLSSGFTPSSLSWSTAEITKPWSESAPGAIPKCHVFFLLLHVLGFPFVHS